MSHGMVTGTQGCLLQSEVLGARDRVTWSEGL